MSGDWSVQSAPFGQKAVAAADLGDTPRPPAPGALHPVDHTGYTGSPDSVPIQSTSLASFSIPAPYVTAPGCSDLSSGTTRPLIRSEMPPSNQISASEPYLDHSSVTAATLMSSNCSWVTFRWPGSSLVAGWTVSALALR